MSRARLNLLALTVPLACSDGTTTNRSEPVKVVDRPSRGHGEARRGARQ